LKEAYYATSRAFHPDANRHLESELQTAVAKVAKRITEAYSVLRDPRRRHAYDRRLEAGAGVRMQLAEAQAEAGRQSTEERQGRTREGRQYFNLALADLDRKDYLAAERHLRTALTFEPDNASSARSSRSSRAPGGAPGLTGASAGSSCRRPHPNARQIHAEGAAALAAPRSSRS
jgi:DnaJ-class molecular chaperone